MKKILLAVLFCIAIPFSANAQSGNGTLGVELGLNLPMSPTGFKNGYKAGFNLGALYTKPLSELFSIGGEANYSTFSADLPSGYSGGSLSFFTLGAFVKAADNYSTSQISPYGRAGLGVNFASVSDLTYPGGRLTFTGENGLAILLGAGVDIKMQNAHKVSFELSYRVNNTASDSFNGLFIDAGYHFGL